MTAEGLNCPSGKVVETEDECKQAASVVGMSYYGEKSSNSPAGCWFRYSTVYFNTEINPALTSPYSSRGGVCTGPEPKGIDTLFRCLL